MKIRASPAPWRRWTVPWAAVSDLLACSMTCAASRRDCADCGRVGGGATEIMKIPPRPLKPCVTGVPFHAAPHPGVIRGSRSGQVRIPIENFTSDRLWGPIFGTNFGTNFSGKRRGNDCVFLQRVDGSRRARDNDGRPRRSAHHWTGLSLPRLQRAMRPLRAHHSPHNGRSLDERSLGLRRSCLLPDIQLVNSVHALACCPRRGLLLALRAAVIIETLRCESAIRPSIAKPQERNYERRARCRRFSQQGAAARADCGQSILAALPPAR